MARTTGAEGAVNVDNLISLVSEKANISEAQARQAVQVVMDHLSTRLPAPIAAQLTAALGDGNDATASATSAVKGLGGLFNR